MKAVGVKYAEAINNAANQFGVSHALLQSIIDVVDDERNMMGIPEEAFNYARTYAQRKNSGDSTNENGVYDAEANLMAGTWWLMRLKQEYGDQWSAVKAYFEMSPVGEGKMRRIYHELMPKYVKLWRNY